MDKEYIDRDKIMPAIEAYIELPTEYENIEREIRNIPPAADVAPVVHGEWEFISLDGSLWCSCCKRPSGYGRKAENKYCRNCGAKMDGGNYEP